MPTFISQFKGLPTRKQLHTLLSEPLPAMSELPFSKLPTDSYEYNYLKTVYDILSRGRSKASRPGQNTLMLDDVQFSIDISDNKIPLLQSCYVPYQLYIIEMLWFLSGATNIKFLKDNNVHIWDDWVEPGTEQFEPAEKFTVQNVLNMLRLLHPEIYAEWNIYKSKHGIGRPSLQELEAFTKEHHKGKKTLQDYPKLRLVDGSIGTGAYGAQWRRWKDVRVSTSRVTRKLTDRGTHRHIGSARLEHHSGMLDIAAQEVDQIADAIKMLKNSPDSRRIIVTAWNPGMIADAALPPCHSFYQFISTVNEDASERELTLKLTQRSCDFLLGGRANIMQYAVLAHMVAHVTGHKATKLIYSPTDCHIYEDQLPYVMEQLKRPLDKPAMGTLVLGDEVIDINKFSQTSVKVVGYDANDVHPNIPYPVAV